MRQEDLVREKVISSCKDVINIGTGFFVICSAMFLATVIVGVPLPSVEHTFLHELRDSLATITWIMTLGLLLFMYLISSAVMGYGAKHYPKLGVKRIPTRLMALICISLLGYIAAGMLGLYVREWFFGDTRLGVQPKHGNIAFVKDVIIPLAILVVISGTVRLWRMHLIWHHEFMDLLIRDSNVDEDELMV